VPHTLNAAFLDCARTTRNSTAAEEGLQVQVKSWSRVGGKTGQRTTKGIKQRQNRRPKKTTSHTGRELQEKSEKKAKVQDGAMQSEQRGQRTRDKNQTGDAPLKKAQLPRRPCIGRHGSAVGREERRQKKNKRREKTVEKNRTCFIQRSIWRLRWGGGGGGRRAKGQRTRGQENRSRTLPLAGPRQLQYGRVESNAEILVGRN